MVEAWDGKSPLCQAYADRAVSPNLTYCVKDHPPTFSSGRKSVIMLFLGLVVESDLAFLPVLPPRSTRKQFHSLSSATQQTLEGVEL